MDNKILHISSISTLPGCSFSLVEVFSSSPPRELKLGLACLTAGLELDASKFQTLQLQTSDIICLGQKVSALKLRSQGCQGERRILLTCLTMATRQSKQSLARGSMVITVDQEIFELQIEWMNSSVFLRLTPQRLGLAWSYLGWCSRRPLKGSKRYFL